MSHFLFLLTLAMIPGHVALTLPTSRSLEEDMKTWAQGIRHIADSQTTNSVFLTMTNIKYEERFDEIIHSFGNMSGAPLAVVALDQMTEQFFQSRGVPCFHMDLGRYGEKRHKIPGWPLKEQVMRGKFLGTWHLLEAGLQVIFAEMDVYFRQDPLGLLDDIHGDFLVSQHHTNQQINVGFYIAKPTPPVRRAFSKVRDWINTEDRYDQLVRGCGCFDQKLLDWAIRGKGELGSACHVPESELHSIFDQVSSDLSWAYIPYARFPHPPFPKDWNNIVGAHAWSGMGPPRVQMKWAKDNGFWKGGPVTSDDGESLRDTGGSRYSLSAHVCSCDDFTINHTQASFD